MTNLPLRIHFAFYLLLSFAIPFQAVIAQTVVAQVVVAQTAITQQPKPNNPEENQPVISRKSPPFPNFVGGWKINHGLSQSPSPVFQKTEVSLVVTQNEKQLIVEQKLRLNGHEQPSQPLPYALDGSLRELPVSRPVAGKAKLSLRWLTKESRLELRSVIETPLLDEKGEKTEDARLLTLEYWELLDHGKLLKVVRIKEWPDRTETSRLIFERQ
jgi:hypothetical protein